MKRKVTRKVTEEIDITTIEIEIPLEEIEGHEPPLSDVVKLFGKTTARRRSTEEVWRIRVAVDTGKIEGWPEAAGKVDLFCKPRDSGSYRLYAPDGKCVGEIEQNYVPNRLVPGEYGDYLGFYIDAQGVITNWPTNPDVTDFFPENDGD
jgi:hypothetical protein